MYIATQKMHTRCSGQKAAGGTLGGHGGATIRAMPCLVDGRAWPRNLPVP